MGGRSEKSLSFFLHGLMYALTRFEISAFHFTFVKADEVYYDLSLDPPFPLLSFSGHSPFAQKHFFPELGGARTTPLASPQQPSVAI